MITLQTHFLMPSVSKVLLPIKPLVSYPWMITLILFLTMKFRCTYFLHISQKQHRHTMIANLGIQIDCSSKVITPHAQ